MPSEESGRSEIAFPTPVALMYTARDKGYRVYSEATSQQAKTQRNRRPKRFCQD